MLLTEAYLKAVVEGAPRGFGGDFHLWDVVLVRKPLTVKKAFGVVETRELLTLMESRVDRRV